MNITTKTPWAKLTLWAVVIHIILIAIAIIEVFIFSLFYPNQEHSFYQEHAEVSGPYISIFFGFFLFLFITHFLSKIRVEKKWVIAFALPIIYNIMDFLMVHFSGVNWEEHLTIFMISFFVKIMGSILGAYLVKTN